MARPDATEGGPAGAARLDLVEALLLAGDRPEFEACTWSRHLGLDATRPHVVVAVVLEPPAGAAPAVRADMPAYVQRVLVARLADGIVARREAEVVAIVPVAGAERAAVDELMGIGRLCRGDAEARFPGCGAAFGVGGVSPGPTGLARSYTEARLAVDATTRMAGLGGVAAFRDLGIERLLSRIGDMADLRAFAGDVLGRLLVQDRGDSGGYLSTLSVYFHSNASPKRTARLLHLHPNTVSYRIRRFEEITGLSLTSYRDRLMVQVALEIVNALGEWS